MSPGYELGTLAGSPSVGDRAYTMIKDAILSLRLEPGVQIVETELAEHLGISKTPVRAALKQLEGEGFVTRIPYKGTFVADAGAGYAEEVLQIRAALEGLAAKLAPSRLSQEQLAEVDKWLARSEAAFDRGHLSESSMMGRRVHDAVIENCGNSRLILMIRNLDDHMQRIRSMSDCLLRRLDKSAREHRAILAAIEERDASQAEQALRSHIFRVLRDLGEDLSQKHLKTD